MFRGSRGIRLPRHVVCATIKTVPERCRFVRFGDQATAAVSPAPPLPEKGGILKESAAQGGPRTRSRRSLISSPLRKPNFGAIPITGSALSGLTPLVH
jgi:hypothetical protein